MDTTAALLLTPSRTNHLIINGQRLVSDEDKLLRDALLYNVLLVSTHIECMQSEGGQLDERKAYIEKRRCMMTVLELLDGVMLKPSIFPTSVQFEINSWQLNQDMIDYARQSLSAYKTHKARGDELQKVDILLNRIDGKEVMASPIPLT